MDFLRLVAAFVAGGVVYFAARTDLPTALGMLGFFIVLSAGWNEARFERIMKAINPQWGKHG